MIIFTKLAMTIVSTIAVELVPRVNCRPLGGCPDVPSDAWPTIFNIYKHPVSTVALIITSPILQWKNCLIWGLASLVI